MFLNKIYNRNIFGTSIVKTEQYIKYILECKEG